jgi:hypothetical protein
MWQYDKAYPLKTEKQVEYMRFGAVVTLSNVLTAASL